MNYNSTSCDYKDVITKKLSFYEGTDIEFQEEQGDSDEYSYDEEEHKEMSSQTTQTTLHNKAHNQDKTVSS